MPKIEDNGYVVHYKANGSFRGEVTSVLILADEAESNKTVWVWAESLPDNVRDFVYREAEKIIERENL